MNTKSARVLALSVATAAALCTTTASAKELVVGLFGGSFLDAAKECHIKAFEKKTGAKVLTKVGNSSQFAAGVRATAGNSDFDIVYVDNSLATQLKNEKLLETIDRTKLTHASEVSPQAFDKDNQYVGFMTGSTVIVYDTRQIKTPPTSWNDLFKPEYAGKVAIGDISGTSGMQLLLALNKLKGGTLEDQSKGLEAIKPLAKSSALLYTQADQLVSMFERQEIAIAAWYSDRAGSAIDNGLPLAVVYPKEGAVGILPTVVIPKGAQDIGLATQFIDELLSPEGQACFAEKKYAGPVNTHVKLSEKAARIVAYGDTLANLWLPDPAIVAKMLPEWTRRWQREIAR